MSDTVARFAREVESTLTRLKDHRVEQIATVSYRDASWPLLCVRSLRWDTTRPTVLISGGVHGDELAGVYTAPAFLADDHREVHEAVQFVVFPCVNPSDFDAGTLETQSGANLNRLFGIGTTQPEVRAIEDWLHALAIRFRMTFDLPEVRPDYVGEGFSAKDNPRAAYLYETVSDDSELWDVP